MTMQFHGRIVLSTIILLGISVLGVGQTLGDFTFSTGSDCATIDKAVDAQPSNGTFTTIELTSNSPSCDDNSLAYASQSWTNSDAPLQASYSLEYTLTASSGFEANVTELAADVSRSSQGPDSAAFYLSLDGAAYTQTGGVVEVTTTSSTMSITIDQTTADNGSLAVRIAFWSAGNSGANSKIFIDNVQTSGSISAVAVLPITLLDFYGETKDQKVILHWMTATETNNSHFEIQRSGDLQDIETIGFVNGQGNSNRITQYVLEDNSPLSNKPYYRLAQVDYDGKTTYFDWIKVSMTAKNANMVKLFQNPVLGEKVSGTLAGSIPEKLFLTDLSGRLVSNGEVVQLTENFSYFSFAKPVDSGLHFIHFQMDQEILVEKVVIP